MNELIIHPELNLFPDIIDINEHNIVMKSPYGFIDYYFEMNKETLRDVDLYRNFIMGAERTFRASREYKLYKSYCMEVLGIKQCQILGNITESDAELELHHNVLGLFDICLLITEHIINTVGKITSFDLVEILIQEHYNNNIGLTFLSKTAHQIYTNDPDGYIPPEQTFGRWWVLLSKYKYGITFEIAKKVIEYLKKYQDRMPTTIDLPHQEEILSFAYLNEYGMDQSLCGYLPYGPEMINGGEFTGV